MERTVKPLKYTKLDGLTERQLKEHHDVLYAGYVKKLNEIEAKLKTADKTTANATFSDLRELKLEETFAKNAIVLHEGYFDNLGGDGKPKGELAELIKKDFGSVEAWIEEFKALGMCARGWTVLAWDWNDMKLVNYICDAHNQGGVWNASALLILDMYEHAFFIDYATGKKAYIETFMKNIDWKALNEMAEKLQLSEHMK